MSPLSSAEGVALIVGVVGAVTALAVAVINAVVTTRGLVRAERERGEIDAASRRAEWV